jgi:hypothetical protein
MGVAATPGRTDARVSRSITAVKMLHSIIFVGMATAILHTLYSGLTNRISRATAVSIASVVGEGAVLLANGGRCPLTDAVEGMGSEHGSVSDIFLPKWFADRIPVLFTPPFALGLLFIAGRRRREHPGWAGVSAVVGMLFLVMPWLLGLDHPRPPRVRRGARA